MSCLLDPIMKTPFEIDIPTMVGGMTYGSCTRRRLVPWITECLKAPLKGFWRKSEIAAAKRSVGPNKAGWLEKRRTVLGNALLGKTAHCRTQAMETLAF